MKTNKIVILLIAVALLFIWSCEKENPATNEIEIDFRKKGGNNDDSGEPATFDVNFIGDWKPVNGDTIFTAEAIPGPREVISVRGKVIQLELVNILLGVDSSINCLGTIMGRPSNETAFDSHTPLQINQERDVNRAKVGLWFRGMDKSGNEYADYLLYMYGNIVGQWPPEFNVTTTINFDSFDLKRSKKEKNACEGGGPILKGTTAIIEVIRKT